MSKFEKEVRAFFEKNKELFGPDARVYSKKEWAERGEIYGNKAPFVVCFEGPFYEMYNYGDSDGGKYRNELWAIAESYGYYFEAGYAWMIYPVK